VRKPSSSLIALAISVVWAAPPAAGGQAAADAHLKQATALLNSIPDTKTPVTSTDKDDNEDAAEELAKLRRQFTELVNAYLPARGASGAELEWKNKFSEVERTLARLIGGSSGLPTATIGTAAVVAGTKVDDVVARPANAPPIDGAANANAGAVGTAAAPGAVGAVGAVGAAGASGAPGAPGAIDPFRDITPRTPVGPDGVALSPDNVAVSEPLVSIAAVKVSTIGIKDLDPAIRRQLEKFRVELELFFTSQK
jgi:hypothetical protein